MKINRFNVYRALIAAGLAIAIGIAITTETPVIALAAVIAGIVLAFFVQRRNKEIVRDERVSQIGWKAASAAFNTVIIVAAIGSLCTALFRQQLPEDIVFFGSIMGYFICAALLLHMGFYAYYSRKM
jgi:uncharacterized membrane protein